MKILLKYRVEYALLRAFCGLVNILPYRVSIALARGSASFAFNVLRVHHKRTLDRIHSVFPEKTPAECKAIAVGSLASFFEDVIEMILSPRLDKKWMDKHVRDIALHSETVRKTAAEGHGVVIMVPHMGNWDLAAWALASHGVPLFAVTAQQRNPFINEWIQRQRKTGMDVVKRGTEHVVRGIVSRLRKGQVFAILSDLRASAPDTQVPFLNSTANVSHGAAMFAVATGAPIIVAILRREQGMHTFEHVATLRPRADDELDKTLSRADARLLESQRLTREVFVYFNKAILETPEQWFWYNKRWVLQPVQGK